EPGEDDLGRERGEPHRRVEAARGERRHRAGRVTDQERAFAGDAPEHAADRNQSAAALDRRARSGFSAEALQRLGRMEPVAIPGHTHMALFTVVHDPGDVARLKARVEIALYRRLDA